MTTSEMFERHLNPQRFDPRAQRVGRTPEIAYNEQQLAKIYLRYIRMGVSHVEAKSKAYHYHTMKL